MKIRIQRPGWILGGLLSLTVACQTPPTEMLEADTSQAQRTFKDISFEAPDKASLDQAVIVDTRSRFAFNMAHAPRSFHFNPSDWQLFHLSGGHLAGQTLALQRRLALNGVAPYTKVIVLGMGSQGLGEEYYAGALLKALGVQSVSITSYKKLSKAMLQGVRVEPLVNIAFWQRPLKHNFSCPPGGTQKPILFGKPSAKTESVGLSVKTIESQLRPQKLNSLQSADKTMFVYGAALTLLSASYKVCIVNP